MHLLQSEPAADGKFILDVTLGKDAPPYAILSHTWAIDGDNEVSFQDVRDGNGKNKSGYKKIQLCATQAKKDGLKFCWIDTCCIDKNSSTEVSEAIISMYRWYRNATKCYAYLSDVSTKDPQRAWRQDFRRSRWFTRNWTLQELLAPVSVEFFSREWILLGNKNTLEKEIYDITRIPVGALRGEPLSGFGVDDRLSWAADRHAKREEDAAYSMIGIFDVSMQLLYGEGREKAMDRLRNEINPSER
ncbi:hypothetical protein NUW58_g6579 [Xylaria curta]|uniref:Uncharacterized protein n=1 Tax=Xylaria curta TaxID=42375 RepID=A0ACC1NSF6_9PEZI|nr:hypothetical protein NUW58_g6579 [Xylaria curta]